jgi:hypothetical protein
VRRKSHSHRQSQKDRGRIGVTDSARFYPNPNLTRSRLSDLPFYDSERAGCGDFDCFVCTFHKGVLSFGFRSMLHLILFSFHPFANIGSAILKLHALRFATREKVHYLAIDHANVFQI